MAKGRAGAIVLEAAERSELTAPDQLGFAGLGISPRPMEEALQMGGKYQPGRIDDWGTNPLRYAQPRGRPLLSTLKAASMAESLDAIKRNGRCQRA